LGWEEQTKPLDGVNLLDLVPGKRLRWEMDGDTVVLLYPKFRNRLLVKFLMPRMKRPFWKIKLDEIGSWTWQHADGKATVKQIGEGLREHFGDKVEPVYDRLGLFFRKLESDKFIAYENLPPKSHTKG
jgi:hypothetical protein